MSHVTFLIKTWSYKENSAPNTLEQVWRVLLSLHYYSIYTSVSNPNQSFYKFSEKINDHLAVGIFHHGITKTKNLPVALYGWFFGNIPNVIC